MGCISDKVVAPKKSISFPIQNFVHEYQNFSDNYIFLEKKLGQGQYGDVFIVQHKSLNIQYACKKILKNEAIDDVIIKNEIEILKKLIHPNIIHLKEFYQDRSYYYLISDICDGGELFDYISDIGQFDEHNAFEIIKQILSGIEYCHSKNIMHGDLKPENILIQKNKDQIQIKIIDFGESHIFNRYSLFQGIQGTAYYVAPEILLGEYNEKCDIWSAGVILYILLCGYPPFDGNTQLQIFKQIKKGQYPQDTDEWNKLSINCQDFLNKLLTFEPQNRISAKEAKEQPWMQKAQKQQQDPSINQNTISNLTQFHKLQRFQELMYKFMISYQTSKQDQQKLLEHFQQIDKNNDGKLCKKELIQAYNNIKGCNDSSHKVKMLLDQIDDDNNGFLDYQEFIMAAQDIDKVINQQNIKKSFQCFDQDNSGSISILELRQRFGNTIDEKNWERIIKDIDKNKDGEVLLQTYKIQFSEYQQIMDNIIQQ